MRNTAGLSSLPLTTRRFRSRLMTSILTRVFGRRAWTPLTTAVIHRDHDAADAVLARSLHAVAVLVVEHLADDRAEIEFGILEELDGVVRLGGQRLGNGVLRADLGHEAAQERARVHQPPVGQR